MKQKGFTLLEMIVVVAIMFILLAIFLFDWRSYDARFTTEAVANEIAASLRQVQVWGTSTRIIDGSDPEDGFGLHFERNSPMYISFIDSKNDGVGNQYRYSNQDSSIAEIDLANGYQITRLCTGDCDASVNMLDVMVQRPNLGFIINGQKNSYAEITIGRDGGEEWTVEVFGSGKVEVVANDE